MAALRPVRYQDLVRVFEQDGFRYHRTEGDHLIYVKAGVRRPLVIPIYHEVPVFIIKNLLRTSGMSRDRYFQSLRGISCPNARPRAWPGSASAAA